MLLCCVQQSSFYARILKCLLFWLSYTVLRNWFEKKYIEETIRSTTSFRSWATVACYYCPFSSLCVEYLSLKKCMVGKPRRGQRIALEKRDTGILLVMHWYKHPAFKYPLTHRCGRTETKGRSSLLRLFCLVRRPNLLMEASGIGKVLKVLISRCGSLKLTLYFLL